MKNEVNSSNHEKLSSVENAHDSETLWQYLLGDRNGILFLGIGLFFVLCNVAVLFGIDTRLNAWLCCLDMRYWSIYTSIVMWITAIWVVSESTDLVEGYQPSIRVLTAVGILLVSIFGLRSFFSVLSPDFQEHPIWLDVVIVITCFCVVRSLFLLYDYRYAGGESIDLEETQWFWGLSGFLLTGLIIFGLMNVITIKVPIHEGTDGFIYQTLLKSCEQGVQNLIRNGGGSLGLRMFCFLIVTASIVFVYATGKWVLICLFKIRERWE